MTIIWNSKGIPDKRAVVCRTPDCGFTLEKLTADEMKMIMAHDRTHLINILLQTGDTSKNLLAWLNTQEGSRTRDGVQKTIRRIATEKELG